MIQVLSYSRLQYNQSSLEMQEELARMDRRRRGTTRDWQREMEVTFDDRNDEQFARAWRRSVSRMEAERAARMWEREHRAREMRMRLRYEELRRHGGPFR